MWDGYNSTTIGGIHRVQTGYGMNMWPTFRNGYPTTNFPPADERAAYFQSDKKGRFFKQVQYTKPAERGLIADGRFWLIESNPCPTNADGGPDYPPQPNINNVDTYTAGVPGQTTVDVYRHGKYPGVGPKPRTFAQKGGKVAYNMLYCDGHVVTEISQEAAYRALRMRFPG